MPIKSQKYKRLTAKNVNRAPRAQGVYALYVDKTLVFLGAAAGPRETIRAQLRDHLGRGAAVPLRYKREITKAPEERLKALLAEHLAAHGKPPAQNARRA
jgi:hypothetical protein